MKPIRSILTASVALAMFSNTLQAEVFPIFEDTVGSPVTNTITKAAGAAKTIAISGKSTAYIGFAVGQSGIDPNSVTAARLTIYFSAVTKPGTISLRQLTSAFTESFTEPKRPTPTAAAAFDNIPLTTALARDFLIIDVTTQVKAWLANPASDFGLAITGDSTVACILASKEGAGSGHPAIIEVDVNSKGSAPVAGTTGSFAGSLFLDTAQSNDGALGGNSIVFGGPGNGEGILSKRTVGDNRFGLDFFTGNASRMSITSAGNVGIGTANPSTRLGVAADAANAGVARFDNANAAGYSGIYFDQAGTYRGNVGYVNSGSSFGAPGTMQLGAASDIVFSANSAGFFQERMRIKVDTGNIGIGTNNPQANLHVQRNLTGVGQESPFRITKGDAFNNILWMRTFGNGLPVNLELFEGDAFKPGGGAWGVVSDRRLKKDIEPLKGALAKVLELNSVTYQYKEPAKVGQLPGTQIGFIAQEVEEVFPEWVTVNADGFKTVTIRGFESLAVQALRELRAEKDAEIAALKAENRALAAKMAAFDEQLTALKSRLDDRPARTVRASLDVK